METIDACNCLKFKNRRCTEVARCMEIVDAHRVCAWKLLMFEAVEYMGL